MLDGSNNMNSCKDVLFGGGFIDIAPLFCGREWMLWQQEASAVTESGYQEGQSDSPSDPAWLLCHQQAAGLTSYTNLMFYSFSFHAATPSV